MKIDKNVGIDEVVRLYDANDTIFLEQSMLVKIETTKRILTGEIHRVNYSEIELYDFDSPILFEDIVEIIILGMNR